MNATSVPMVDELSDATESRYLDVLRAILSFFWSAVMVGETRGISDGGCLRMRLDCRGRDT